MVLFSFRRNYTSYNETPTKGPVMRIKEKAIAAQNHVSRNRAKYAAGVTFVGCFALHYYVASAWNDYLRANGMLEDFYKEPAN